MGTAFVYSLDGSGGEDESDDLFKFGDVDTFLLEIRIFSGHASRIKLSSASPIGVSASNFRALFCNYAGSRHISHNLHDIIRKCKLISSSR